MDHISGARDHRFVNLNYNMGMMGSDSSSDIYGPPSTSQLNTSATGSQLQNCSSGSAVSVVDRSGSDNSINIMASSSNIHHRGVKRSANSDVCYNISEQEMSRTSQNINMTGDCISDNTDDCYSNIGISKKSPPSNGKKTKGRVKIKMEYIDNKLRRYTTFSKRKTGIMKKAYELSTLTGTQVMLLVASETGHVYTFATRKLQPMITSEAGKALIQTCLNSPDPPNSGHSGDQRMSATGFEETELTYNISDDEQKVRQLVYGSPHGSGLHIGYSSSSSPSTVQHVQQPSHTQHAHLVSSHSHGSSPNSHLVSCSSPSTMLSSNPYVQSCSSPLPPHATYHPHISHSHPQR